MNWDWIPKKEKKETLFIKTATEVLKKAGERHENR